MLPRSPRSPLPKPERHHDRQCADHCRHRSFGWRGDSGRPQDGLGAGRLWHERDHRRCRSEHMRRARLRRAGARFRRRSDRCGVRGCARRCGEAGHDGQCADHRGGRRLPDAPCANSCGARPCHGRQERRSSAGARGSRGVAHTPGAAFVRRHAEPARGRRPAWQGRLLDGRRNGGCASGASGTGIGLGPSEGRASGGQRRERRSPAWRSRQHRLARTAHRYDQRPRHRLHPVGGHRRAPTASPDGRGRPARQILSARGAVGIGSTGCGPGPRPAAPFPCALGLALTVSEAQARLPVERVSAERSLDVPCCLQSAKDLEH